VKTGRTETAATAVCLDQ